ncbi:hypothetical protein [Marinobacterium lutimaris]|uniref:Tryptophan synthase subunit beta like protein n=1 Tax=Marinobacterium lutimaris TaxID=568106 RepID=A0A1H6AWT2_9GAMM|nr:hypothetical protein [Marinobacterium lutimaris]SEG52246.1 hypothetical protein SAMN05444390_102225 [Marinobacterium lutimaris]
MLYAQFDDQGKVKGLTESPLPGAREVSLRDPEVLEFLAMGDGGNGEEFDPDTFLQESDKATIRILEDLIDTLIGRHLIRFTDLPMPAQKKLLGRRLARSLAREEAGIDDRQQEQEKRGGILSDEEDSLF